MRAKTKIGLTLSAALVLSACATPEQKARLADPRAGFGSVSGSAKSILRKDAVMLMSAQDIEANAKRVHALVHKKTISADTAVQVALRLGSRTAPRSSNTPMKVSIITSEAVSRGSHVHHVFHVGFAKIEPSTSSRPFMRMPTSQAASVAQSHPSFPLNR